VATPGASKPTYVEIQEIVMAMKASKVKPFMNGNYKMIATSATYQDLLRDPDVKFIMEASQTGAA
jgi:hypothetical protein